MSFQIIRPTGLRLNICCVSGSSRIISDSRSVSRTPGFGAKRSVGASGIRRQRYRPPIFCAMETERLYFADPYLTTFSGRVIRRGELGGKPAVLLDRSAFYPEGGGQPADTGTLNRAAVIDVQ